MGFRVAGRYRRALLKSAPLFGTGQPLATLDELDLKLLAEQADAEFSAATGVLRASERRRSARQRAPAEGLVDGRPIGSGESGRR